MGCCFCFHLITTSTNKRKMKQLVPIQAISYPVLDVSLPVLVQKYSLEQTSSKVFFFVTSISSGDSGCMESLFKGLFHAAPACLLTIPLLMLSLKILEWLVLSASAAN